MDLQAGQGVKVGSALRRGWQEATVIEHAGTNLQLFLPSSETAFEAGNVLQVNAGEHFIGMAIVRTVVDSYEAFTISLTGFCWLGKRPRAERRDAAFRVALDYLERGTLRKTVGETTDISHTGVRVKLRNSMMIGTVAHLVIRLGATDELEALARVRRIVEGPHTRYGGYDVAFGFERLLKGNDKLFAILGENQDSSGEETEGAPKEWFAPTEAA